MVREEAKKVVLTDAEGNYIVPVIDPADKGGGGLEICDIGMALYVDETKGLRRYLNGQIVDINTNTQAFLDRLQEITTLHPSLLCTEEEWQTAKTMSAFGQVGKFVFNYSNDEIVSVRIPRVVNVQGLFDLQNLGMTVEAGLPTHTHTRGTMNITGRFYVGRSENAWEGAFVKEASSGYFSNMRDARDGGKYYFDASRSWTGSTSAPDNPIYGKSNTVQPEAIQYPYFIQIATGSETKNNIRNDIELNNPYSLFDSKYSNHELNNLSWLKSSGQWNSKAVYTSAYDKLLKVQNGTETVAGLSVKLSTETYTDYDFVLNTADETFRLPLLNGMEGIFASGYKWSAKISKSLNITYTAETNGFIVYTGSITGSIAGESKLYINDSIVAVDSHNADADEGHFYVPVNKGDTYKITDNVGMKYYYFVPAYFVPVVSNGSLYYYVGETVQNANLIDAGRIGEQLVGIQDKYIHIIDTYVNGTSGYRVWSDGYCEQWGRVWVGSRASATVTLLKAYSNLNYKAIAISIGGMNMSAHDPQNGQVQSIDSTSQITVCNGENQRTVQWETGGYLAEGQY